jgi:phage head maturation protease
MIAMRIAKTPMGDKVWNQVKEGKLNGFSVSGFFEEVQAFTKEEMFLYKVAEVLKNIK